MICLKISSECCSQKCTKLIPFVTKVEVALFLNYVKMNTINNICIISKNCTKTKCIITVKQMLQRDFMAAP